MRQRVLSPTLAPHRFTFKGAPIRVISLAAALSVPTILTGTTHAPVIRIADSNYQETDRLGRPPDSRLPGVAAASPSSALGISSSALGSKSNFPYLIISGLAQPDAFICARIRTIDGYYEARARQALPRATRQSGIAEVVFPRRPQLSSYQTNEIAVLVFTAPDARCFDRHVYLESHWADVATQGNGNITLFVSQGPDAASPDIRRDLEDVAEPCARIGQRRGISTPRSYQFACTLRVKICRPVEQIAIGWNLGAQHKPGFLQTVRRSCAAS